MLNCAKPMKTAKSRKHNRENGVMTYLANCLFVCATALLLVFGLVACDLDIAGEKIEFSQFIGTYVANFGSAEVDQIEFREDSIYVHEFQAQNGQLMVDSGRYIFQEVIPGRNEYTVRFEQFVLFSNDQLCSGDRKLSPAEKRVEWRSFEVRRTKRGQSIHLCHNERRSYVKVF